MTTNVTDMYLEAMRRTDARDIEGFLAMQADDAEWRVPGAELHGKEELRAWLEPFVKGFSSYRHDIERVVENGNTVWAEGTFNGVNDGPLMTPDGGEAPPTGRPVRFRFGMSVTGDLDAGLASEVHIYFDQLEFLSQLGLIPEPAPAG
jgi:ketosteroid isomerase-like protein